MTALSPRQQRFTATRAIRGVDGAMVYNAEVIDVLVMPGRYGGDGHHAVAVVTDVDGVLFCGVTFNGWVGNHDWHGNAAELVRDVQRELGMPVDWLATQETKQWRGTIHGWQRVDALERFPHHPEAPSTVLHVNPRNEVIRPRILPVIGPRAEWIGPKHGNRHRGRIHAGATVQRDGVRVDVLAGHHVWGEERNARAYAFDTAKISGWMLGRALRHPGRSVQAYMDWNGHAWDPAKVRATR